MTPILKPILLAALAINVAIGIAAAVHSQTAGLGSSSTGLTLSSGTGTWTTSTNLTGLTTSGNLILASSGASAQCYTATANGGIALVPCGQPQPTGAIFHQVVDRYFDADGNQLEVKSATHAIDADCQPGRRQQDLIAQDDGKGRVQFAQTRLPSEPATGQKPVTKDGIIKATLAIKQTAPDPAQTQLAEAR